MRTTGAMLLALVVAGGCKRTEPAAATAAPAPAVVAVRPVAPSTAPADVPTVAQPAMPAADAGPATAPYRIEHPTCGSAALDGRTHRAALEGAGPVTCVRGDAGVAWTLAAGGEPAQRFIRALTMALRQDAQVDPARLGDQLRGMDAESRRTDDNTIASVGLLFRAPDRMRGRIVRVEGTARDVHEANGETTLSVVLDLLGRERIEVTYPSIASDSIVNDARVIVHGVNTGSHTVSSALGDQLVPEVSAVYMGTPAEVAALERLPPPPRARADAPEAPSGRHGHGRRHRSE